MHLFIFHIINTRNVLFIKECILIVSDSYNTGLMQRNVSKLFRKKKQYLFPET